MTNARSGPCAIWVPTSRHARPRSTASRYSGKLVHSQVMPSAMAEPGMSSTPSMRSMSQPWRSGAAGAKPTPQLPMTTVVTPCQELGVTHGSQETCAS